MTIQYRKFYGNLSLVWLDHARTLFIRPIIKHWQNGFKKETGVISIGSLERFHADLKEVIQKAKIQANLTHCTDTGRQSAVAVALSSWYFLHNKGGKKDLPEFLRTHVPKPIIDDLLGYPIEDVKEIDWGNWSGRVNLNGVNTARAAISAILKHNNLADILKYCVDYTGDTDTVSSIALSIASCSKEITSNLPAVLYDNLENGKYGREYLEEIDKNLMELLHASQP